MFGSLPAVAGGEGCFAAFGNANQSLEQPRAVKCFVGKNGKTTRLKSANATP
jgi:hypothetical protein